MIDNEVPITGNEDTIYTLDIFDRIQWLTVEEQRAPLTPDEREELYYLSDLWDSYGAMGDWPCGETLIRDTYFTEYAQELAWDIGALPNPGEWPGSYIDWERAANALKTGYFTVEVNGHTYWSR